ncbi:hypothetical protein KBZ21_39000, partial [Streptomyces sp. A73]|nr:hypothetical protein [Streptomyces sp. A73]
RSRLRRLDTRRCRMNALTLFETQVPVPDLTEYDVILVASSAGACPVLPGAACRGVKRSSEEAGAQRR